MRRKLPEDTTWALSIFAFSDTHKDNTSEMASKGKSTRYLVMLSSDIKVMKHTISEGQQKSQNVEIVIQFWVPIVSRREPGFQG